MLLSRKITFFFFLLIGVSLAAQQNSFVSSYVRGNFYNRGFPMEKYRSDIQMVLD